MKILALLLCLLLIPFPGEYEVQAKTPEERVATGELARWYGKDGKVYYYKVRKPGRYNESGRDRTKLNKGMSSKGHGLRLVWREEVRKGRTYKVFEYVVDLPGFYTAPGDTPCDRGSMRKNGKGVAIPITNVNQLRPMMGGTNSVFDSNGRFLIIR